MGAIAISLLLKFLPYLAILAAILSGYFLIKGKGTKQEREKWQKAQAEAKAKQIERINEAVSQDTAIDAKVRADVEKIKQDKPVDIVNPGDRFKF